MDFYETEQEVTTSNELVPVTILLTKIRNKPHTVLCDFDSKLDNTVSSEKEMLKKLKTKICTTGGHIRVNEDTRKNEYVLQGNKKMELVKYLYSLKITDINEIGAC